MEFRGWRNLRWFRDKRDDLGGELESVGFRNKLIRVFVLLFINFMKFSCVF